MTSEVLAIIQARMSSTRLPGKVLMEIMGKPMLELHIERIQRSTEISRLVVATSIGEEDNPIETLCRKIGVSCFRGSLDDVLDRFFQAAKFYQPKHVVRLTGDCPLADPAIIDRVIKLHLKHGYDYTSNTLPPTWPDGMDVEIFRFSCLKEAAKEAKLPSEREHVTPFIQNRPQQYALGNLSNKKDLSGHRLTVDEIFDFDKVKRIYAALHPQKSDFSLREILSLIESDPELSSINDEVDCDAGVREAKIKDRKYLMKREL